MGAHANDGALLQLQAEQARNLTQGGKNIENAFQRFDTPFYQGVEQAYENQNNPLLMQQYRDTNRQLDYRLARQGLSYSSAGKQLGDSLKTELARNQQQLVSGAQQASEQLQNAVANQKAALYAQLQTSQNPTQVAQAAANLAGQTGAPSTFQPIGQLFNNWSNMYLANQVSKAPNATYYNPYLQQTAIGGNQSLPQPQY